MFKRFSCIFLSILLLSCVCFATTEFPQPVTDYINSHTNDTFLIISGFQNHDYFIPQYNDDFYLDDNNVLHYTSFAFCDNDSAGINGGFTGGGTIDLNSPSLKVLYTNNFDFPVDTATDSDSDSHGGGTAVPDEDKEYKDGILGWFQKLFDNIVNGFASIGDWFNNTWEKITAIPGQIIDGLKTLFIPTVNPFTATYDTVISYFPFVEQVRQLALQLVSAEFYGDDIPTFTVDFSYFGGGKVDIVDLSFFQPYRTLVHGIIIAVSYGFFIFHLVKRLPTILTGNVGSGGGS